MIRRSRQLYADPVTDYMTGYVDHRIEGAASFQTNYTVQIRIYRGYGATTGRSVYIPASECRHDFSDIRFVDDAGRSLPHFRGYLNTASGYADFWVLLYEIPTTGAMVRILYGAGNIASASNVLTTFPTFADDFSAAALDTSKWAVWIANGSYAITGGSLVVTGGASGNYEAIGSKTKVGAGYAVTGRIYFSSDSAGSDNAVFGFDERSADGSSSSGRDTAVVQSENGSKYYTTERNDTAAKTARTDVVGGDSLYHIVDIGWESSSSTRFQVDFGTIYNKTGNCPSDNCGVSLFVCNSKLVYVDWAGIRKYVYPEPAHGWWGSLEDL